jgi:hypothetical protein
MFVTYITVNASAGSEAAGADHIFPPSAADAVSIDNTALDLDIRAGRAVFAVRRGNTALDLDILANGALLAIRLRGVPCAGQEFALATEDAVTLCRLANRIQVLASATVDAIGSGVVNIQSVSCVPGAPSALGAVLAIR